MGKDDNLKNMLNQLRDLMQNMDEDQLEAMAKMITGELPIEQLTNAQFYRYQRPDYSRLVTTEIRWLKPFRDLDPDSEDDKKAFRSVKKAATRYAEADKAAEIRSFVYQLLNDFDSEADYHFAQLYGPLWAIEQSQMHGEALALVLEVLRQDAYFYNSFISGLEELMVAAVYQAGQNQVSLLESFLYEQDLIPDCKPIVMCALIMVALRQPQKRMTVVAAIITYLKHGMEICRQGASSINMEQYAIALATAHISEALPVLKAIYDEFEIPMIQAPGGFEEIQQIMNDAEVPFVCTHDNIDAYLQNNLDDILDKDYSVIPHGSISSNDYDNEDSLMDFERTYQELYGDDDDDDEYDDDFDFFDDDDDGVFDLSETPRRYVVRIELMDGPERSFRTLQVPSNIFLSAFTELLMTAFGRQDVPEHYEFVADDGFRYLPGADDHALDPDYFDMDGTDYSTLSELLPKKNSIAAFDITKGKNTLWHHGLVLEAVGRYTGKTQHYIDLIDGGGAYPRQSVKNMAAFAKLHATGKTATPDFRAIRQTLHEFESENGSPID